MINQATSRRLNTVVALVSLLFVATLVVRSSTSAFSDTTDSPASQWSAGNVTLVDDDSAMALFAVDDMAPAATASECITVTYEGSLDATVALYGELTAGDGLDEYLDVVIRRGTGGRFGNCDGFTSTETVFTGTLAEFVGAHTDHGNGAGTWAPTGGAPDDDMTYQFDVTLRDDNAAQGLTASASFTWEAQNS